MTATPIQMSAPPAWRTYLKSIGILIPIVCAWVIACIELLPKVREIWHITHFSGSFAESVTRWAIYVAQHAGLGLIVAVMTLALLEWRSKGWPRYRGTVMYATVLFAVVATLLFLVTMLAGALMAAPALRNV